MDCLVFQDGDLLELDTNIRFPPSLDHLILGYFQITPHDAQQWIGSK